MMLAWLALGRSTTDSGDGQCTGLVRRSRDPGTDPMDRNGRRRPFVRFRTSRVLRQQGRERRTAVRRQPANHWSVLPAYTSIN